MAEDPYASIASPINSDYDAISSPVGRDEYAAIAAPVIPDINKSNLEFIKRTNPGLVASPQSKEFSLGGLLDATVNRPLIGFDENQGVFATIPRNNIGQLNEIGKSLPPSIASGIIGTGNATRSILSGFTTPANIATLGGIGVLSGLAKAGLPLARPILTGLEGYFAAQSAKGAGEKLGQLSVDVTQPTIPLDQKIETGITGATDLGFAAMMGKGAAENSMRVLDARLAGKTPEQQSKAIREEVKVTEDKRIADALTDAADQIDREIAARDAAEAQAKEQQRALEQQQKASQAAQQSQVAPPEVPKSTQILQESQTPPSLANVATEAGTQTSPFALQGKLNEITSAPKPAIDPALAEIAQPEVQAAPEAPLEATASEIKANDIRQAVNNPQTQYQFTVQQGGEGYPGYVQVDAILPSAPSEQMRNTVSSSVSDLNRAGAKLPEVPDWVPTGQYTQSEIEALIKKGSPNESAEPTAARSVDRSADLGPDQANNPTATEAANPTEVGGNKNAIPKQSSIESLLGRETAQPQLDVGLRQVGEGNAQPETPAGNGTRQETGAQQKVASFIGKGLTKAMDESKGQFILDTLEERGVTPAQVVQDFWDNTYDNLSKEQQAKFDRYIRRETGASVGDTIGTNADGSPIVARSIKDLYDAEQAGGEISNLEGTERGLIALMANANEARVPLKPSIPAEPNRAIEETPADSSDKINALNESKLVALADQLGIKTMGMSGERLRSRIISNARPEDIIQAIDNPVAPKAKGKRIKGSAADKWADRIIGEGRTLANFDPELLAAHTIKLIGQLQEGAVKFSDWSAEKIKEAGDAIKPYLQQIWDSAHKQLAALPGERVLEGDNRGTSRSALGKYDYIKTSNAEQIAHGQQIVDYVKRTKDYAGGFAKLREIQNSADRAVAAASMIPEAENITDPMARDRIVAQLFREAKGIGTDVAQGLQAQGTVNDLIAPYRGHLAWMDLIQSRLKKEVAPKFPENSAEIINKGLKDAGNKAAEEIATDTPGAASVLKGAISRVRKSLAIDWRKVFTDLPENQEARKVEIFNRINEDPKVASLPEAAKTKLAQVMNEAWENLRQKEFRKEFEKTIALPNVGKEQRIALEKAYPDLIDRANLGVLDNQAFLDVMGRQYGIPSLDSETGQKLRDLGQKAARTPEGSERNEVYQQIMDTIMQARGINPWDFLKDFWYRNVMSAPRTAIEIGAGGIIQGAARTFTTAVDTAVRQNEPGLALRMIGMFLKDAATGARLGADLVATGDRAILPRYTEQFLKKMENLEQGKSPGGEIESLYRRSSGATKAALAPFEMTGRLLTALDYIGGQGVRSQQMLYSALTRGDKASFEAAMRRFNAEEVVRAEKQARAELGDRARPAQVIARQREILNQGIDKQIQDFGNTMTEVVALNAPPAGIGGEIYKAVSKLPMAIRAPGGLAFAKAGLNIFQELTNWAPITGQINLARSLWRNPNKNNPFRFLALDKLPLERARQTVIAQAAGLAILTAAASKFLGHHDEDDQNKPRKWEISGSWVGLTPTQKAALMSAGERPLSIKFPDGRWIDYRLTPFMSSLATIGHIRDQERFNGKKFSDEDAMNKSVNAWLMGLASIKDLSLASSFSKMAGFLASDDRQVNVDGVERSLADSIGNSAIGLIPMSSLLRELDNTTDSQRYRPDQKNPGVDLWLTQIPFVRRFVNDGKPLLNFLGEPVTVDTNPFNRHIGPGPSTAPVESALSDKVSMGMKLPVLSDNTTIVDKTGKQRPMTGDEIYEYQKSVRQAYARQIASDLPAFAAATPQQAALYSQVVFTAAERYARDRLNTGAKWDGVIPLNPKLSSALSPEYEAVKKMDSDEGSASALNAAKTRINIDNLLTAPREQKSQVLKDVITSGTPEQGLKFVRQAVSPINRRTALESATSNLTAPSRAEFFLTELAKRNTAEEKSAYLQKQFAAGLINKEVLRQMAIQGKKN